MKCQLWLEAEGQHPDSGSRVEVKGWWDGDEINADVTKAATVSVNTVHEVLEALRDDEVYVKLFMGITKDV
jgi:hypothetical protein